MFIGPGSLLSAGRNTWMLFCIRRLCQLFQPVCLLRVYIHCIYIYMRLLIFSWLPNFTWFNLSSRQLWYVSFATFHTTWLFFFCIVSLQFSYKASSTTLPRQGEEGGLISVLSTLETSTWEAMLTKDNIRVSFMVRLYRGFAFISIAIHPWRKVPFFSAAFGNSKMN